MTEKEFNHMILPLTKNIYAYAQHILSNPTDAADITQEVMIKLWNTRRELKGVQNPRAWALKVTRNLCLDWIKKQKPVYGGEELAQNEDYTSNPLQEIEIKDTVSLLRQIIDTLPENQREVLILREIEELEFEEIEQITGLTANHIRVLLSRGRSKVKEMMRNER
ncbi:sigma-70 family RNA polymerase sigma factor [Odoribacter splanchnicus]|nr:sigma-70 family RNA polymerase sigma factor [Odoribacter splanchnicus]